MHYHYTYAPRLVMPHPLLLELSHRENYSAAGRKVSLQALMNELRQPILFFFLESGVSFRIIH